jgi:hypothetical protein
VKGWQTPLLHVPVWHEWPHAPQLFASLLVLTQVSFDEQNVGVADGHEQTLDTHADLGAEHAVPQPPQYEGLLVVSTQVLLQIESDPGHDGWQVLLVQLTLPLVGAVHVMQLGPQLLVSVLLAHLVVVPHWCSPDSHDTPHTPPVQVALPPPVTVGHALPHALQFWGSVCVLVQVAPHRFGVVPEQLLTQP